MAVEGNSTLVEFTLTPEGDGTRLRVVETGFEEIAIPEERQSTAGYDSHSEGWTGQMKNVKQYAEQLAA